MQITTKLLINFCKNRDSYTFAKWIVIVNTKVLLNELNFINTQLI